MDVVTDSEADTCDIMNESSQTHAATATTIAQESDSDVPGRGKKPPFSKYNSFVSTKSFDLEWDRDADFNQMTESDTLSNYDLNARMAEILAQRFLDFEMSTYGGDLTSIKSFPMHVINSFQSFDVGSEFDLQDSSINDLNESDQSETTAAAAGAIRRHGSTRLGFSVRRHKRVNTNGSMTSNMSAISDPHTADLTPSDCFTLDDLFRMKLLSNNDSANSVLNGSSGLINPPPQTCSRPFTYEPITFDLESLYSAFQTSYPSMNQKFLGYLFSSSYQNFHHSSPDLTRRDHQEKTTSQLRKHLSLPNLISGGKMLDIIHLKPLARPTTTTTETTSVAVVVEAEIVVVEKEKKEISEETVSPSSSLPSSGAKRTSSISYSRLSRLEMLRNYVSKLGERIKQILTEAFQNNNNNSTSGNQNQQQQRTTSGSGSTNIKFSRLKELYSIDETDEKTYDIIELDMEQTTTTSTTIQLQPGSSSNSINNNNNSNNLETELSSDCQSSPEMKK